MHLPAAVTPEAQRAPGSFAFVCLALAWLGAGCGGAKAATPPPPPHLEPQPAPAAPLPKSRWLDGSGATIVGPALAGGTLVLIGGRRALVDRASVTRFEEAPSPEPLEEVTLAPTPKGPLLLGRGRDTLYVFETPLGPARALAQTDGAFTRIGAGPGFVATWTTLADLPVLLDLATGLPAAANGGPARLPELPARAIAFLDERRGAAVFEAAGLAVTSDGGATFRLADDGGRGDALRVSGLRIRGDALHAFVYADGPDAAIDPVSGRLDVAEPIDPAAGEADLVRWVRITGRDPLEAAASGGVEARDGRAITASHGLLAQVDLATGGLLELAEFARGKWVSPCSAARAGGAAWVACAVSEDASRDELFDPFGVFRVPLGRPRIEAERPSLVRNGEAELVVSPSGGAMLLGPCSAEDEAEVCVRRPDGAWSSMRVEVDLGGRGAGPLADGRIAFLRGLVEGDQEREQEREQARDVGAGPPANSAGAADEEAPRTRRVHLALTGGADREEALPPFDVPAPSGEVRVLGAVEEEVDHSLRLVVDGGGGPEVVIQPRGRAEASVTRVPFAAAARLRGGHGVAVGDGRIFASLDAGSTWGEIAAPPFALESARAIAASPDGWTRIEVSDAGVKLGSALRLGWGAPEDKPMPAPEGRAPRVEVKLPAPLGPERQLTCVSDGAGTGAVPLLGGAEVKARLADKPPREGTRRESSSFAGGRAGMLDTVALLEEEGPAVPGATPSMWRLAWFDPTELGGAPRAVTLPPYVPARALGGASGSGASGASGASGVKSAGNPRGASEGKGPSWGASLQRAAAAGGRALFSLRVGGKSVLVRASGDGKGARVLTAEVAPELAPSGEVVFGVDRGEPIAWMHDATLVVWLAGEAPRAVASIATRAARSLGQPTRDGVPVLLNASDWAMLRVVPIPPLDPKGSAAKAQALPSLDGWKRAISIPRGPFALPACAGAAKGARFAVPRASLVAEVDGTREIGASALYDVRVAGESACVAGVSALVAPDLRADPDARGAQASRSAPSAHRERGGAASRGPVAFVRADLITRRAEGGARGVDAAPVRRLRCALEAAR